MDDIEEGSDEFNGYGSWAVMNIHCDCAKVEVHVFPSWMDGVECTQCGKFHGSNAQSYARDFAIKIHSEEDP